MQKLETYTFDCLIEFKDERGDMQYYCFLIMIGYSSNILGDDYTDTDGIIILDIDGVIMESSFSSISILIYPFLFSQPYYY